MSIGFKKQLFTMNIKYEITLQDDLDAKQTYNEWNFNRPWLKWIAIRGFPIFLCLSSLFYILLGIYNSNDPYSTLSIVIGIFFLIIGIIFPLFMKPEIAQSNLNRRSLQKKWNQYYSQKNKRNIVLTETEFIFKTSHSEMAWSWQVLKSFYEGTRGFKFDFFSGHTRYIPKRVFANQVQIENFKQLVQQYKDKSKPHGKSA